VIISISVTEPGSGPHHFLCWSRSCIDIYKIEFCRSKSHIVLPARNQSRRRNHGVNTNFCGPVKRLWAAQGMQFESEDFLMRNRWFVYKMCARCDWKFGFPSLRRDPQSTKTKCFARHTLPLQLADEKREIDKKQKTSKNSDVPT
jgi:hypothetical protein